MHEVGGYESSATKCGVARRDGSGNHSEYGEHSAKRAKPLYRYVVYKSAGSAVLGKVFAKFSVSACECNRRSCPYKRYYALSHHCSVKHRTGKLLVFEASCHHGRLCGMESRYRATGYRHKHHREQGHRVGIGRAVIEALRHSVGYRDITKEENAHYSCSHEE